MVKVTIKEDFKDKVKDLFALTIRLREVEGQFKDAKDMGSTGILPLWKERIIGLDKERADILSEIGRLVQSSPAFREDVLKWIDDVVSLGVPFRKLI